MKLGENLSRFLPGKNQKPVDRVMALVVSIFIFVVLLSLIAGFAVFSIVMKGEPVVSVPNIVDLDLGAAMEELQNYGLEAEVHMRNPRKDVKRGSVFAQRPTPGASMRKGGEVILSVSRGMADLVLENYIGKMVDDVKDKIDYLNDVNGEEVLTYKISKIYHKAPSNEVINQDPAPGHVIKGATEIVLQVSQGLWVEKVTIPDLVEKDFKDVIDQLSLKNIPFNFRTRKAKRNEKEGVVIAQTPEKGAKIKSGSFVDLTITIPKLEEDYQFGIFEKSLPVYKTALSLKVSVKVPREIESVYYEMKHPGGNVSIPYNAVEGTKYTVFVEDEVVAVFTVQ